MSDLFKVYVVFGQCGEYSDHRNWPVRGFMTRDIAERFEFALTKAAKAFADRRASDEWWQMGYEQQEAETKAAMPDDPGFQSDYTGTDYYTLEVEVSK